MLAPIPKERITAEQIVSSNKWFQGLLPQEVQPAGSATPVSTAKEQKTKEATISAAPTKAAANPPVQER